MALNFQSVIAKIPFGKYKGTIIWQAPTSWWYWVLSQEITDATLDTATAAMELKQHEGEYAVLRMSKTNKFLVILKSIHTAEVFALAHCKEDSKWKDIVYPINSKQK